MNLTDTPNQLGKRTASHFRDTAWGMVLVATRGPRRREIQFPPSFYLDDDEGPDNLLIGPIGQLYTYTVVHPVDATPPYSLAMVDFAPGVRVLGRLQHGEGKPTIGGEVRIVPFALPDGTPDYAFHILRQPPA